MDPMLGREVIEREQNLGVIDDLGDGPGPFRAERIGEGLDRGLGVGPVLGVADLREGLLRGGVRGLRQRGEDIRRLVDPASLRPGLGEDLAERGPHAQCAVADHHHRGAHPTAFRVAQQIRPAPRRLAMAIGDRHQLLGPVDADPDDHQTTQPFLLEADVEMHAVGPAVHEVGVVEFAFLEQFLFVLPGLGQPGDHRRRQPRRAEELTQRRREVA